MSVFMFMFYNIYLYLYLFIFHYLCYLFMCIGDLIFFMIYGLITERFAVDLLQVTCFGLFSVFSVFGCQFGEIKLCVCVCV